MSWLERTELLVGTEGLKKIKNANILIVGLGGVGSFAAEFIVRAGVNKLTIVDGDIFDETNKNRQLPALNSTIGKSKAFIMAERIKDINSNIELKVIEEFISPEKAFEIVSPNFDYVIDCIDSITPKVNLIVAARRKKVTLRTVSAKERRISEGFQYCGVYSASWRDTVQDVRYCGWDILSTVEVMPKVISSTNSIPP